MTSALYVAAGGGGDAIAATILARRAAPDEPACVATYAWERLIIDPLPGPRGAADFDGLIEHAPGVLEITSSTTPRPPAGSTLPRLAAELPVRLFLLDPYEGAVGIAEQLTATARYLDSPGLVLVDVGGDLVATGTEDELRSPLADFLALAACALTEIPCQIVVAGPGLDGELSGPQVLERFRELNAETLEPLASHQAASFQSVFTWHPSEATGLWTAAAKGYRGTVEIRDAGTPVALTDISPTVTEVDTKALCEANRFVTKLKATQDLPSAEQVIRDERGSTELDYERRKAATHREWARAEVTEESVKSIVSTRVRPEVDFVTVRRLCELLDADWTLIGPLLQTFGARVCDPPLWILGR